MEETSKMRIAIVTSIGLTAVVALLFAYPAVASSLAAPQNNRASQIVNTQGRNLIRVHLSIGQTIRLTSTSGGFREAGNPSMNGTAGGLLSLKVTGAFTGGYALAVTGGSLTFNGTTYIITSGSAELGPYGAQMVGQGQAGSSQILFVSRAIGRFGGLPYGILGVNLSSGSKEFTVRLLVTISS